MIEPIENEFEEAITERMEHTGNAWPHVEVPVGHFAMVTYQTDAPDAEPMTEIWREGQIVPATLLGGAYQFESGLVFRLAG